jgi:hypothetical protein
MEGGDSGETEAVVDVLEFTVTGGAMGWHLHKQAKAGTSEPLAPSS